MGKRQHTEAETHETKDAGLKKPRLVEGNEVLETVDSSSEPHHTKKRKNKKSNKTRVGGAQTGEEPHTNESTETEQERKQRKKEKKERKEQRRRDREALEPQESLVVSEMAERVQPKQDARYEQHPDLSSTPQTKIDDFLTSNSISVVDTGSKTYRPILHFSQISPSSKEAKVFESFTSPTPIQAATWPHLLSGRDVIGVAETGSGKTLAYGVPLVRHVASKQQEGGAGIKALVVSPTRELALQIHEQFEKLVVGTPLKTVCIYGGMPKDEQRPALRKSHIVVATPGRLNDFIQEGAADLSDVSFIVLDEADRMLEKGFEDEMRKIVGTISTPKRQTAMFTATWPESIRDLAATFMTKPVRVNIGDASGELRANNRVAQRVEVLDPRGKETRLVQLLKQHQTGKSKDDRILVFCLYKKEASRVERFVRSKGFQVAAIHGDMNQHARMESLDGFRSGKVPLLIATDVAARGLDIPAVKLVINVTFPLTVEDYVHRIGRTGRAGKDGLAITLFTEHEKTLSGSLINVLRAAKQPVPEELLKFGTTVKKKTHEAYGAFYKDTSEGPQKSTKITFD